MTVDVHVTLENDLSLGILTHKGLNPGMGFPLPAPTLSIEMMVSTKHLPGYFLNKNKLTSKVVVPGRMAADGLTIMLDGHDHGPFIRDLTPAPAANLWYLIMWPTSSRKCAFSAARVMADDTAIGGAQITPVDLPYVTCGEPLALPTARALLSFLNNVIVGFDPGDIAAGYASIAAAVAIELIFDRIAPSAEARTMREAIEREVLSRVAGVTDRAGLLKLAVGALVDGLVSAARGRASGTGDWSIKVPVGSPFFGGEVGYSHTRNPQDGGMTAQHGYGPWQESHAVNKRQTTTTIGGDAGEPANWDPPAPATRGPR